MQIKKNFLGFLKKNLFFLIESQTMIKKNLKINAYHLILYYPIYFKNLNSTILF